jgi:hypothetical protein
MFLMLGLLVWNVYKPSRGPVPSGCAPRSATHYCSTGSRAFGRLQELDHLVLGGLFRCLEPLDDLIAVEDGARDAVLAPGLGTEAHRGDGHHPGQQLVKGFAVEPQDALVPVHMQEALHLADPQPRHQGMVGGLLAADSSLAPGLVLGQHLNDAHAPPGGALILAEVLHDAGQHLA